MTGPGRQRTGGEPPIGRRMAELRTRRGMSQQVFADRIGKSKSWVDKVERGVRTLDRLSVIETVAGALGVAPQLLLTGRTPPAPVTDVGAAVERVRAALARHDAPASAPIGAAVRQLDDQAGYAWTAYRNGQHPQVLRMLPGLLVDSRHACHVSLADPPVLELLVRVYRLTAQTLVKLGDAHLAWLAADRAMMAATRGDPLRIGLAAVSLTQALRRGRLATTAALTAVRQLDPAVTHGHPPASALTGTLLIEAALAAAGHGDAATAHDLTERAAHLAADHERHDQDGVTFGPISIDLARALTATRLGDHHRAVALHRRATDQEGWRRLPAEHRAAHLIDITRAHLDLGDHDAAGRALVTADRIAPAETRTRPAARVALTAVLRAGPTPADVARLAATIGLTRP
ncbi:Helix-turn-helix domain-containing protein [Micromonospora matsumotoense]|uniref:Helix-turn-helix domain-containing protein n=1 Tax=Micromonospora matsumotoense TaxID=121616 RepID=A0A1C5ATD0_9ACTN|nr:helix-turn-helix domain-containing protein [Micromonospora matsumotoense]SCF48477.1 Helix-turn-helix domain-containing protein [Micromonospora matsumotoense]